MEAGKVPTDHLEAIEKPEKKGWEVGYPLEMMTILENTIIGIAVLDLAGVYRLFNRGAEMLTGYKREEILGKPFKSAGYSADAEALLREALAGKAGIKGFETCIRRSDGSEKDVVVSMAPQEYSESKDVHFLLIMTDNSDKKHYQDLLLRSRKMETIGEMAGEIAHDFNNLLEGVLGYTTFMMDLIEPGHELWSYLEIIESSARKAADLTERLQTLSRGRGKDEETVDCNPIIREVIKLLERTVDRKISFELNLDRNLKAVRGSAGQLEQAFLNLCLNARDAMPEGGRLTVSSENITIDDTYPKISLKMKAGEHVHVSISDTGIGMDRETTGKIFEPFFTTKGRGEGTGLGLNMVYSIVDAHEGFIDVQSEIGKGTTVNIYLRAETWPVSEEGSQQK